MDPFLTGSLLKKLCSHISGNAEDNYQWAVSTLSTVPVSEPNMDCEILCDSIKQMLVHEKKLKEAARFSFLFTKFQQSTVLKNKSAVLKLFFTLRNNGSSSKSNFNLGTEMLQPNIRIGQCFSQPSLYNPSSKSNRMSFPSCSNSGAQNDMDTQGRVARLASLYGDSSKQDINTTDSKKSIPKSTSQPCLRPVQQKLWKGQIDVSRDALIREVLFALQGIEGNYIKFDVSKDCFKIDEKILLSVSEKAIILKVVAVGWLYSKIKQFCDTHGRYIGGASVAGVTHLDHNDGVNSAGLVNQSLVLAIKEELNEYCRLIAILETQMNETGMNSGVPGEGGSKGLTFRRLLLWTLDPRDRLMTLARVSHSVRNTKGGASLSAIYQHIHHGDPAHVEVVRRSLWQASRPFFLMIIDWMVDGTLNDPHGEFFISADPTATKDRLWLDKYDIRWPMVPSFLSATEVRRILATGKSLNFLRHVCAFKPTSSRENIKSALKSANVDSLFDPFKTSQLTDLVSLAFDGASSQVLEQIMTQHKLIDHLSAIRRYLLLGQGDFISALLSLVGPELSKPADCLQSHNLSYLLETAIGVSNAHYEDPDILKRLDVRLLQSSPDENGWDIFSLDYHVDGPIGTVFTSESMRQYLMLFNALWRAKRMEAILSSSWKHRSATAKLCRSMPELHDTLHRAQLLQSEMNHLLQQMAYYVTFEVLECSWHHLVKQLALAKSLDDVIDAHSIFLKKIVAGTLLDESSREIRTQLRTMYDLMVRLESLLEKLYEAVVSELAARDSYKQRMEERTLAGEFGTTSSLEKEQNERQREFSKIFVPSFQSDLSILSLTYQDMAQAFLLMLAENEDENLQLLKSRLDFNEYYVKKDHRLNLRMTYLHKRKSMGASFCGDSASLTV